MTRTRVLPPASESTWRLQVRAAAASALFVAFAGDALRNAFTMWGFSIIAVAVTVWLVVLFVKERPRIDSTRLPKSLIAYLLLAFASLAWSAYPGASAFTLLGVVVCTFAGLFVATMLSWPEVLRALGAAVKWVLGLSILFELLVSVVLRHPLLPVTLIGTEGKHPALSYWSRNELFTGDRIQGIVGNANLLGVIALIGIIVFSLQLAGKTARGFRGWFWLGLAVLEFLLTRSSTMIVAAAIAAVALAAALGFRHAASAAARRALSLGVVVVGAGLVLGATVFSRPLLGLLGKSSDLTGRLEIWDTVQSLAAQTPVFGLGFSSPWVPWVKPFDSLVVRHGVVQLQAHNAWLDVWLQLGILGVIVFAAVVFATLWRVWFLAVDRPRFDLRDDRPYTALSLLPLLIITVLIVQSFAESRILIESGWVLLTLFALKSKQHPVIDSDAAAADPVRYEVEPA